MRYVSLALLFAFGLVVFPTRAQEKKEPEKEESIEVPYRLTLPKHVLLRAKINGKGPYNFILDTGAPALFLATKVAKELGVERDNKGWGTFDTFEIEGGVMYKNARGRIEDPFQLKGMNGMGLAGAELHGVIGYNLLAQYRMTFDFTKNKMIWTKLDFTPKPPLGLGQAGGGGQGGMEIFGTLMETVGKFLGRSATPEFVRQGFVGIEVENKEGSIRVSEVAKDSPAEKGGLKVGDVFEKFNRRSVYGIDGLTKFMKSVKAGDTIKLRLNRDGEQVELELTAGEGL